ncbi:MAG: hypothetical protein U0Y10_19525 [Spirosomataceae bacterium]
MKKGIYFIRFIVLFGFFSANAQQRELSNSTTNSGNRSSLSRPSNSSVQRSVNTRRLTDDVNDYNSLFGYGITTNTNAGVIGGGALKKTVFLNQTKSGRNQYHYFGLELVNVKHPKEKQLQAPNGSRFIYGKQNYLLALRPQYGREITLFHRSADEGVQINGVIAAGPSIGIVKPYYIQYEYRRGLVRTEPYDPAVHTQFNSIIGSGNFFEGFDQATFNLGGHIKTGINFELDAFRTSSIGLEIGFLMEQYSKEIVIFPKANNRSFFTSGYITLYIANKK